MLGIFSQSNNADSGMYLEEAKGRFESRSAIPGHVQQGYVDVSLVASHLTIPSPRLLPTETSINTSFSIECDMLT